MKAALLIGLSLVVGIGLGLASTRREFSAEQLPTNQYLQATTTSARPQGAGAKLEIEGGSSFNFGKMDRHAKGEHTFVIRNTGSVPIGLRQGQTTCKCTLSEMKDGDLQPGESVPVNLSWTAKTGEQDFSQSAEILTTGYPEQPVLRLHVFGKIIDALRADRNSLSLGSISASENQVSRFKLLAFRGDEPLAITGIEFTSAATADHFSAEARALSPDETPSDEGLKSAVEVTVRVKSGLPLGAVNQTIRLTTNLRETAPYDLPIEGQVVGDIQVVGRDVDSARNSIRFGTAKSKEGLTKKYHLLIKGPHREATKLEIAGVEPVDGLQAELGEALTDNPQVTRYPLTIKIPAGATPIVRQGLTPESAGVVRISTTHPQVKELVLIIRYAVIE